MAVERRKKLFNNSACHKFVWRKKNVSGENENKFKTGCRLESVKSYFRNVKRESVNRFAP